MAEPENLTLKLLRGIRASVSGPDTKVETIRSKMATKEDLADARAELRSLAADVVSDQIDVEKRLGDQIATLRRAVMEYPSSTIGHGVPYSEIEERVGRIEQHLKLDAH